MTAFTDADGAALFDLKRKTMVSAARHTFFVIACLSGRLVEQSLRGSYEAHAPDGTQLFEVQGHMKCEYGCVNERHSPVLSSHVLSTQ